MMSGGARTRTQRADTRRTRLMGAFFGLGSVCFIVAPLTAYATWVGAHGDALTFFIGSILFTAGGVTQARLTHVERREHRAGLLAWRGAWVQGAGTVMFNVMTLAAISHAPAGPHYNTLVWTPNALGSICFLVSGALLYLSAPRRGRRPLLRAPGWWEPPVNLLGCALFGLSAVAGYAIRPSGQLINATVASWTTTAGAVCFLAVALAALLAGMSFKIPRLSRVAVFERAVERAGRELESDVLGGTLALELDVAAAQQALEGDVASLEREL